MLNTAMVITITSSAEMMTPASSVHKALAVFNIFEFLCLSERQIQLRDRNGLRDRYDKIRDNTAARHWPP